VTRWSGKVETHWHPPEGLFTESASTMARVLEEESDTVAQAIERLQFYMNRAGRNLSREDKRRLEKAKALLHKRL
jgi:ABC-type multidrug transport system ATPase subunit